MWGGNYFAFPYVTLQSTAAFIISTQQPPQSSAFSWTSCCLNFFNTTWQLASSFVVTAMINVVWMQIQHELHNFPAIVSVALLRTFFPSPLHSPCTFRSTKVCSRWQIWGRQVMHYAGKQEEGLANIWRQEHMQHAGPLLLIASSTIPAFAFVAWFGWQASSCFYPNSRCLTGVGD